MKTPATQPLPLPVRLTRSLRIPFWKKTVSSVLLAQFALWSVQVKGETWTQTGAGPFTWTTAANWTPASVPNGIDAIALLQTNVTANQTINLATGVAGNITLGTLSIGDLLGAQTMTIAPGVAGSGLIFDVGSGAASLNHFNGNTDVIQTGITLNDNLNANIYAGTVSLNGAANAPVALSGSGNLIKNGAGRIQINPNSASYTGNWVLNLGTIDLGAGANNTAPTALGTGTGGITLNGSGSAGLTVLSLQANGTGGNGTATWAGNNDVIVNGSATIDVRRNFVGGANDGVTHILDNLTMNGGVLVVQQANNHRLRFDGTTTLVGDTSVFSVAANGAAGFANLTLQGVITDGANSRALIKEGVGRMIVSNAANTYNGVTAVKDGILQVGAGANLGSGATIVNGGAIGLTSASQGTTTTNSTFAGGLNLVSQLGTSRAVLGAIVNTGFTINGANPLAVNVPTYGMALEVDSIANAIDLSQVGGTGNTRVYLSNTLGFDTTYTGTVTANSNGAIRLASGGNQLILNTANQLGGAGATSALTFGVDWATPTLFSNGPAITHGTGGTVSVRANNANTLGAVTVNRGVTVNINGAITTPLGTGVVTALGGAINTDNATAAQFGNTDFRLYGGSTLTLDNRGVVGASTDRRLINTTSLALTSSTLSYASDGGAAGISAQTIGSLTYRGGSFINIGRDGATAGSRADLTVTAGLTRSNSGTLVLGQLDAQAATLGTASATSRILLTSAPAVNNGMIGANIALLGGANMQDTSLPLFTTYDVTNGIQAAAFGVTATNVTGINTSTASTILDINGITGTNTLTANVNAQAVRLRTTVNTQVLANGGFTVNVGTTATAGQGAGLYLVHTADNAVAHSANFAFGTQEGLIYTATTGGGQGVVNLTGTITGSNGITRFGPGILSLAPAAATGNTFTGALTINSGETRISQGGAGAAVAAGGTINPAAANSIDLWGGATFLQSGSARYNNNITFNNDARLGNVNVGGAGFGNLTVAARSGSTAPIVLDIRNQAGNNVTNAFGGLTLNGPAQAYVSNVFQINGAISGTGALEKWGNERLFLGGDSTAYTQAVTVNTGFLNSLNAAAAAKPFGTGAITVNPGGSLRVAAATNLNAGQVTLNSDLGGISGIAMTYVGDPAALAGAIAGGSSAPGWRGYVGIAAVGFSQNIDQSTLWGGNTYLGAPLGEVGVYTGALTPAAGNNFLLGTGQGTTRIASPLTGGSNNVVIGTSMTGDVGRANQNVNNSGGAVTFDVPMTYGGSTTVQPNISLRIAATNAVTGIGAITLNGGTLQADSTVGQLRLLAPLTIANAINLTADSGIQMQNNASDFRITGALSLAAGSTGVVRQLFVGSDQAGAAANNSGNLYLDGGITDGVGGSGNHFIKAGASTLMLSGTQTYTGTTTVAGGILGINADADFGTTTQILLPGGGLGVYENSFTTSKNLSFTGGNGTIDVMGGLTLTQSASSTYDGTSALIKRGLGTLILNGTNAQGALVAADGILQVNSLASMGNPALAGTGDIQFGGDFTIGNANNPTRYTGGTLRVTGTFATNRGLQFNNNGNTTFSGGIDVTAGNTLTLNGAITQGTEFDYGFKTGAGTLITNGTNTHRQFAVTNGTLQFDTAARAWTNSTATAADNTNIDFIGGTVRAVNTGANIALTNGTSTTNYRYGGGGHIRLESGAGFSIEFAGDNLVRDNQGTLVIETTGGTTLGGAGATNAGRILTTNVINSGLAAASALNNGIFAPHLIAADATGVAGFTTNGATGINPFVFAPANDVNAAVATTIDSFSTAQTLTANRSIYAFSTTANVSGNTLRILAIDNVRMGGILINGSNTISSNIIFDPANTGVAAGAGTLGEGLIYVKTGESAVLSGALTSNALTKFGRGTLTLSGGTSVLSELSVQDGILKLGAGGLASRMNTELNVNAGATLDLNGNSVSFETIGSNNRQVAGSSVGGSITNTGSLATLEVGGPISGTFTGTINGTLKLQKSGAGVLTIDGYRASTPDSGNNTFTGGTAVYGLNTTGGINLDNATFGLGGFGTITQPSVDLYSGTLGLLFSNTTTAINGTHGQVFSNQVVKFGADAGLGLTLNVRGPAQVNVNQGSVSVTGQGNLMQVGDLNMTNNTLNTLGGNLYRLRVAGTTTILGPQASFQTNSDGPSGAIEFTGVVAGSGAINKLGDGSMRTIVFSNTGNTFSGGLNIIGGDVQNSNPTANTLGTGPVNVFPDGTLRIGGNAGVIGANLKVMSRVNSFGAVALDDNFNPTVLTGSNFSSAYGVTLQIAQPYWTQALNMAAIGDGTAFLGSGINNDPVRYMATTLGAGAVDAKVPGATAGVYRIAGGVTNFAFEGVNNVFTGDSYLQVGPQRNMIIGTVGNSGNAVFIRNSNNYTQGTQIASGTVLISELGGSPVGETPLGTGAVEVYGEYRIQGNLGSNWKADTSTATNTINLRPGGQVRIFDTTGDFTAGGQGKWGDATGIDLNGGQFTYSGATQWNNVETIGDVTARKGGLITVTRANTASSAQLNVGNIDRIDAGTLTLNYNAGFLGTNLTTPLSYERLTATLIDGATIAASRQGTTFNGATAVNGGILPVWIVDQVAQTYVGYDPTGTGTGFQPLRTDATAPAAGELTYSNVGTVLPAGTGAETVNITGNAALAAAATSDVWALRVGAANIANTGAGGGTITSRSGGLLIAGASTINAALAGVVQPMTLNFGVAGAGEAIIYTSAAGTIQARIVAAQGLTKFGASSLQVNSINPGIDGPVTVNAGTLIARVPFSGTGTPLGAGNGVFGGQDVILNAGALQLDPFLANAAGTASVIASDIRATAVFDSNIIVRGSAGLNNNGQANFVRIKDLTFQNGGGAAAMDANGVIALALQSGVWVDGTTTLIPQASFNQTTNSGVQSTFAGQITESGVSDLEKFGNGTMTLLNGTSNYTGGTTIWGTTNNTNTSIVASGYRGAGTPFGTGAVTVQPGGLLRIADTANITSNVVNLKSDGIGLAGLGIAYNGALPTITTGVAAPGQVHVETTGPFAGVITLDYGYYSQPLTMSSIPGGSWFLGNSGSAEGYYFNQTLGAASNGKYLLGGGGSQGTLSFGSVSVGAVNTRTALFENIFTGGSAGAVRIEVGAMTNELFANGPSFVNGNSANIVMVTRNTGLVGDTRVNTNTTLALGNNFALGSGRLILNGGNLRYDFGPNNAVSSSVTLNNNVLLQGDFSTSSGNELVLNGNVDMGGGAATGATRTWNLTGTGPMAVGLTAGSTTNGVISGLDGSNLIKVGGQQVSFRGANTYQGYTQIGQSSIVAVGDVLPGVAGPLGNSTSAIILAASAANAGGGLSVGGKFTIGRDIQVSQVNGTGVSFLESRTNEIAKITGGVSIITGATLQVGSAAVDVVNWRGGLLDIQGPISGAGILQVGTAGAAPAIGGTVLLSASSNGYGTNTYSGGTNLQSARLQIASDTYYTGLATAPTILSGPIGTGTLTFQGGESNRGGTIEAIGGPRIIVNALGADATAATSSRSFSGHEALTFTRNYDISSDPTLRSRNFTVNNLYQPVTFSGNLSNSGAEGSNLVKSGAGVLVLTGTNTQAVLAAPTTGTNYGTGVFIDGGILRVNADAALGNTSVAAGTVAHTLGGAADVRLRGGVLQIATGFSTTRQFVLTVASGIDVAAGQTLTLPTVTVGAFNLTKTGNGTLALNNSANTITNLILGGAQQINPNVGLYSNTGGTVSTTATTGTPFAATSVTINSGTLSLADAAAQILTIPTLTYGAAGQIATNGADVLTATALARGNTFNTFSYGTLILQPSSVALLGTAANEQVTTGTAQTVTNGTLATPSVFARLAGANQAATFVTFGGAFTGFGQVTYSANSLAAGTAVAADLIDVAAAGEALTLPTTDVYALRTAGNITIGTGASLNIGNGGLIMNPGTLNAPATISPALTFGTGAASNLLTEAIVYVADTTGASVLAGNLTARDFTKTGPGLLEISGATNVLNASNVIATPSARLPVVSVQDGTLRFASTGAQFTNGFRPAAVNTTLGSYVLNVNEAGIFDMNGLATTLGGLTGNGTVTSNVAGAINLRIANGFGVDPTFSGLISNGSGTVSLTKTGDGIMTLTGHGSYTGGTTVESGRVTNAIGSTAANGRLEAQKVTALGTGPITLQGGTLNLNATTYFSNAQTASEVTDGFEYNLWGGVNGYDLTVSSTAYAQGVLLPANVTSTLNAGTQNAGIGTLTVNAPIITSTAGLIQVNGATTFNQDTVIRTAGGRLFLAGQVNAGGYTLTKTGANDVVLTHTEAGAGQNSVGAWKVYGGTLNPRVAAGASNPLGSGVTVEINTGATGTGLLLSTDGDGTAAAEMVTTYADTNIRFGSLLGVSSNAFVSSGLGRLQSGRIVANNDDKTVVVNNLVVGGVLGSPYVFTTSTDADSHWVNGTTTFTRDMYLQNDARLTLNGVISGNGTFVKRAGGDLFVNAANTYTGGTVLGAGGTTYLGSMDGNRVNLSTTAQLGGQVIINPASRLLLNSAGNVQAGQTFAVGGNLNNYGVLGIGSNDSLDALGYRALGTGGIQSPTANYYIGAVNPNGSVLAINTTYTQSLNQRTLGDGMGYIGSTTNGVGANGLYDAATLAAGRGDTYRLGAGGATLFVGLSNANVLTNADASCLTNLIIGAPMSVENNNVIGNGSGTVVLLSNNNYGGTTWINRNSTLDFRGTLATSSIETYGGLNVAGEAGTFIGAGPVTLRPGSTLRFDNTSAGVLPAAVTAGRWADATPVNLNNSTVRMQGNAAVETSETVGTIASTGGSFIELARGVQGRTTTLVGSSITRGTTGLGTIQINHTAAQLGTDEMLKSTAAPTVTNGMVAPWMVSNTDIQFLTYNADTGITLAGFDSLANGGTTAATVSTPTSRVLFQTAATVLGTGFDIDTYAARLDQNLTLQVATTSTVGANRLIVQSGGLILNGTRTVTTGIQAGPAGASELLLFNNGTVTLGDNAAANRATSGQIAASSITKFGAGQLNLNSEQQAFAGNIRVQQGSLVLRYANGTETDPTSTAGGVGSTIFMEGPNTTLFLRGGQDNLTGNVTFNNSVVLGDYNPIVQIDADRQGGTISNRRNIIANNLTFGANNAETGQILRYVGANAFDLQIGNAATDLLTLVGKSVFNVVTSTADVFVAAKTTGTGNLVMAGGALLELSNVTNLNDYSGGTTLMSGTLLVRSKATNVGAGLNSNLTAGSLGTGAVTLLGGTLNLLVDSDVGGAADANNEFVRMSGGAGVGVNLNINGSSTINVDRNLAAGSNKILTFNDLSIGSQILTTTGVNGYAVGIGGTTTMSGNMFLNTASADAIFTGTFNDGGAGLFLNKIGTSTLYINSVNNTATSPNGGLFINAGLLDFGNRNAGSTTANFGVGDIYVNPNATIRIRGVANINTGAGQQVVLTSTPYSSSLIRTVAGFTQAQLVSMIQPRTTTSNEVNYISFEAAPGANNLDQSGILDGRVYFGGIGADFTYTGAAAGSSLTPGLATLANSVVGGTSTNRVYRLGMNSNNTLIINLTAAGAGLGNVGGATDVMIGSLATLGTSNFNQGFVYFQDQNTYTGQTVVSRGATLRFNTAMAALDAAGPLGIGSGGAALIDIYGGLRSETGSSFRNAAASAQYYTNINLHPGSILVFQDMAAGGGNRWDDAAAIRLDGAALQGEPVTNTNDNAETVGAITFDRGARIYATSEGTGDSFITAASVTRASASAGAGSGRGTLTFIPSATATFGAAASAGVAQQQVKFTTDPTIAYPTTSAVTGMLPGFFIDGTGGRFVTHNATTGIVPVADGSMVAFTPGMTAGTAVVNMTATTTLPDFNPVIYGLRIAGANLTLNSPTGANNDATVTFGGSGADVGALITTTATAVINPNLKFGTTGTNEALLYIGGTTTLNGNITAGSITKFGAGQLNVANDQSDAARGTSQGYQGGWVINEGSINLLTFGSAGNAHVNNTIVLNANQSSTPTLFLRAAPADTLLNYTYTSGKIYVVDNGVIDFDPGADDRVHTISDIEIQQSGGIGNAAANGTNDAQLRIVNNRSRTILAAGSLTLTNNAILNVDSTLAPTTFVGEGANNAAYLTNGVSTGMSVASLAGNGRLTKWGDGTLYVRGASTNSGPVVIDQGAIHVTNNASLGSGALTINRYGVLEVGVAGYVASNSSTTYNEGSVERWSVDGARTGSINLGKATLQVGADQNQTVAVTMNGGSIEGWVRTDDVTNTHIDVGVFRNLGANVSITLASNSYVGNPYYLGANGLDSGRQTNDYRPTNENIGTGATLNIKGVIDGAGSLTKVGYDTVILSGANTYTGGTVLSGGTVKLGATNALPTAGSLSTYANGVLDLNGYNQTVGVLTNPADVATNVSTTNNGYITNSAVGVKTLTAGNATNATYRGVIQNNVALEKMGASTLTLTNANTYVGNTNITAGNLALGVNGSVNDSPWINIAGAASTLDVSAKSSYTYDGKISGGGSDTAGTTFATVTNAAKINGNLIVGDHVGEICLVGTMAPGSNSIAGDISTAGNQVGQIYTNGNLTINGQLAGTASTAVDRMSLQLTTATVNANTLGAFDYTATWLTTNASTYLTSTTGSGSLAGHDYINVGGALTLNQYGRVVVSNLGAGNYAGGDVFNLIDWVSLTNNAFSINPTTRYSGAGDSIYDLDLPELTNGNLWDTSLFISHGVIFVVPEPSRLMLLFFGLFGLFFRRRRND